MRREKKRKDALFAFHFESIYVLLSLDPTLTLLVDPLTGEVLATDSVIKRLEEGLHDTHIHSSTLNHIYYKSYLFFLK